MDITVGTAGHIDHGKTALVKALTGMDTDRLPEEKQRGITIDLGFAELELGDLHIGFVDVPGHEKFVKNMLAGIGGIDLVMLVVAADEGVMPQTREHFDICRLLETGAGMVVVTKSDLVDDELLDLVRLEISELVEGSFLENAPVEAVSSKTGEGIDELKTTLADLARLLPERTNDFVARMPIDRSFSVKGFGTVVTGTILAGEMAEGDELEILPGGLPVRVRGVQTHRRAAPSARAGQRAAINLGGVDHTDIERGMALCEREVLRPTQALDTEIEVLTDAKKALRSRQRVRVHIGTVEALARVQVLEEKGEIKQGERGFVQLRLESPVAALPGDRFIVRSYSPQTTIAGGRVLDAAAKRRRGKEMPGVRTFLKELVDSSRRKTAGLFLDDSGGSGATFSDLQARTGWRKEALQSALTAADVVDTEGGYLARAHFENLKTRTIAEIGAHHRREPLSRGVPRETLRERLFSHIRPEIYKAVLDSLAAEGKIAAERDTVRLLSHSTELSKDEAAVFDRLRKRYENAALEPPKLDEALAEASAGTGLKTEHARKIFQLILNAREVIKISDDFYFRTPEIDRLVEKLKAFADNTPDRLIDVPKFKEIAGISRKYAIPLLEYFDRERVTQRAGDKRLILK